MLIQKSTFTFLQRLTRNNNREWFLDHKAEYDQAKQNVEDFVNALIAKMNQHDDLETTAAKKSLYRIYKDVRFSNDKTPYNPRFAGYLRRRKPFLRGGYYFWIRPGGSAIGCGFASPGADDLRRIRQDIDFNSDEWHKLLTSRPIVKTFGQMTGEQVKTTPRGYAPDNPAISLLRFKQFWFERSFSDKEVLAKDFLSTVNNSYKTIRPFFDYMTDVLGSDGNGQAVK